MTVSRLNISHYRLAARVPGDRAIKKLRLINDGELMRPGGWKRSVGGEGTALKSGLKRLGGGGTSQRKRDRVIAGGLMVFVCMGTGRRGELVIALGLLCVENRDVVQSASKSHP